MTSQNALLEVQNLKKSFGGVQAVKGVSFSLFSGEAVAVVGDNGAGKSTVVKMISGAYARDEGEIRWNGSLAEINDPDAARGLGIETMYQDLALIPDLDAPGNVFLGQEPMKRLLGLVPVLDRKKMEEEARKLLERVRINLPSLDRPVRQLSGGQRQAAAIARFLLSERARLIIMDEPTAALGVQEQRKVLDLIQTLKAQEMTILVVSHNLEHVFDVCDRIIVFRAGEIAGIVRTDEVDKQTVVSLIMGGNT
ncbi:ATP-binding cassette domain-containing protein [Pelagibacterium lentulum]|uniref:Sugar ABC transporter ATP-binding protein n=1 Tax=Pelagibacterium lentulum TaxID=2029865 RepID=A0A916VWS6_9HYPH|nr:ATP-binding cassette domain-containing protein [Pelagibacterium lentulum]GGA48320.1 sugar ABC transporter ATP-binding protein [Pelagibacterium lentulum]